MKKSSLPPINYDERFAQPNIFRDVFGSLSDAEWAKVLVRSIHEPEIDGVTFPRFPDVDLQNRIHGTTEALAIQEAFQFFQFVKARVGKQHLRPSARFLDFGSGWGRMLRPYLRYFDLVNIYAFEPNPIFVTVARSLNPYVTFLTGEFLPNRRIPRHMFDLIVGWSIFSHLSRKSTTLWLKEMSELLNPGGLAVFTTWGSRFIDELSTTKAKLEAGQEVHWYQHSVLDKVGDPAALRKHFDEGRFIWIKYTDDDDYGDTILSQVALQRILTENAIPLEIASFDTFSLPQDAFILRRL